MSVKPLDLLSVHVHHRPEQLKIVAEPRPPSGQRMVSSREAGSAVPRPALRNAAPIRGSRAPFPSSPG